ncbi:MAG: methyltransferase family protein, partial [Planctomycetota bacterium]
MKERPLDGQAILDVAAGFQEACVLGAAAELDLFTILSERAMPAEELADLLGWDRRATSMLLGAVAALQLLDKQGDRYAVPDELRPWLVDGSPQSVLPMIWHRMNILRGWSQLAWVVKAGIPCPRPASVRGAEADRAAFIAAMHTVSGPMADGLVAQLGPPQFEHLLDVGGASGTWTLAFLRAAANSKATIFDLP